MSKNPGENVERPSIFGEKNVFYIFRNWPDFLGNQQFSLVSDMKMYEISSFPGEFLGMPNFKTPSATSLKTAPSVGRWVATARESQEVVAWLKSDKWGRKTTQVSFCLGFDRRLYLHSMYISCKQLQLQLQHIHVYM